MSAFPTVRPTHSLANLAELSSIYGTLKAFWDASSRSVFLEWCGQWYQAQDGNIVQTISTVLGYDLTFPGNVRDLAQNFAVSGLTVFEGLPNSSSWSGGTSADSNLEASFYNCDWSDYATDFMAFRGSFDFTMNHPRGFVPEERSYRDSVLTQ
jgi:hypothetical protein